MAELRLSDGRVALVDDQDLAACLEHSWFPMGRNSEHVATHVSRRESPSGKRTCLLLHRFIAVRMGLVVPPGHEIDFKDVDSLNNQRENLRVATRCQQMANRRVRKDSLLGIKGVRLCESTGRFRAEIKANGVYYFLGRHDTPELAAVAYARASAKYHGEFGRTS